MASQGVSTKITYENKLELLCSQESKAHEETRINKTRKTIEILQSQILVVHQGKPTILASI